MNAEHAKPVQLCTFLPCGYLNDSQTAETCTSAVVTKYQKRISGPLPDRIDIYVELLSVDYEELNCDVVGETSAAIHAHWQSVRNIQLARISNHE